ncbi:MAG: flagellar biosynthesis protein FlhB [Limnohabitans sp.]|nr:flagellar biosynthesis protein FlhB [Limnohabitans sp.]
MKTPFEAIALEYGQRKTPRIVAKGQAELAQRIIQEAKRQGIYVTENPQLLALLSKLDVGEEITQDMYTAVAVILSWVYWLKDMQPGDEKEQPQAQQQAKASNLGKAS